MLNFQKPVCSSDISLAKLIICKRTKSLNKHITSSQWQEVKKELLAQNELDVFARESIEEVLSTVDNNIKNSPSKNLTIKNVLLPRLVEKDGTRLIP